MNCQPRQPQHNWEYLWPLNTRMWSQQKQVQVQHKYCWSGPDHVRHEKMLPVLRLSACHHICTKAHARVPQLAWSRLQLDLNTGLGLGRFAPGHLARLFLFLFSAAVAVFKARAFTNWKLVKPEQLATGEPRCIALVDSPDLSCQFAGWKSHIT